MVIAVDEGKAVFVDTVLADGVEQTHSSDYFNALLAEIDLRSFVAQLGEAFYYHDLVVGSGEPEGESGAGAAAAADEDFHFVF